MEEWPNRDQLAEPERDSSPILSVSLPTFPYPLSCKKPRTMHSSSACVILGSDPDAVGVHVALKETPLLFEFSLPTFSLPTFPAKSLGHAHSSSACLILGSDPDAVGVCVALKEIPCPL